MFGLCLEKKQVSKALLSVFVQCITVFVTLQIPGARTKKRHTFVLSERRRSLACLATGKALKLMGPRNRDVDMYDLWCPRCGNRFHSSIDKYTCRDEKVQCRYPLCISKDSHNIFVCPSLNHGCKNCGMRGHDDSICHPENAHRYWVARRAEPPSRNLQINTATGGRGWTSLTTASSCSSSISGRTSSAPGRTCRCCPSRSGR